MAFPNDPQKTTIRLKSQDGIFAGLEGGMLQSKPELPDDLRWDGADGITAKRR